MICDQIHGTGRSCEYRSRPDQPRRPAPGEPGTLRQQLAALADYLELQSQDRLEGPEATRRWLVAQALHSGSPIAVYERPIKQSGTSFVLRLEESR